MDDVNGPSRRVHFLADDFISQSTMTAAKGGMARIQRALQTAGLHQFKFHARLGYFGVKLRKVNEDGEMSKRDHADIILSDMVPPRMIDPSTLSLPMALKANMKKKKKITTGAGGTSAALIVHHPSQENLDKSISSLHQHYIQMNDVDFVMSGMTMNYLWGLDGCGSSSLSGQSLEKFMKNEIILDLNSQKWKAMRILVGIDQNIDEGCSQETLSFCYNANIWDVGRFRIMTYGPVHSTSTTTNEDGDYCPVHFTASTPSTGSSKKRRNRQFFDMLCGGSSTECRVLYQSTESKNGRDLLLKASIRKFETIAERFVSLSDKNGQEGAESFVKSLEILQESKSTPSATSLSSIFKQNTTTIETSATNSSSPKPSSPARSEPISNTQKLQQSLDIAGLSEFKVLEDLGFVGWRTPPCLVPGESIENKYIGQMTADELCQNYEPDAIPKQIEDGYLEDQLPIKFDRGDQKTEVLLFPPQPPVEVLFQRKKSQGNDKMDFSLYSLALQLLSRDILDFPTPGNLVLCTPRRQLFAIKTEWSSSLILFSYKSIGGSSLQGSGHRFERLMTCSEDQDYTRSFHGTELKVGPFQIFVAGEVDAVASSSNEIVELKLKNRSSNGRSRRNQEFFQMIRSGSTMMIEGRTGWLDGEDQIFLKSIKKYELTDLAQRFNHDNDVEEMQSRLIRNLERLHALKTSGAIESGMLYELYQRPSEEGGEAVLDINPIPLGAAHLFPPNHVVQDFLSR